MNKIIQNIKVGDFVQHEDHLDWGIGTVVYIAIDQKGNQDAEIIFSKAREKKIRLGIARINKLEATEKTFEKLRNDFATAFNRPLESIIRSNRQQRIARCHTCKKTISNKVHFECAKCGWILCWCGACGCNWS